MEVNNAEMLWAMLLSAVEVGPSYGDGYVLKFDFKNALASKLLSQIVDAALEARGTSCEEMLKEFDVVLPTEMFCSAIDIFKKKKPEKTEEKRGTIEGL